MNEELKKGLESFRSEDFATAIVEFIPLAEEGNAEAQYRLGLMHDNGDGTKQNSEEAIKWYTLAAKAGHAQAQGGLGWIYADFTDENGLRDNFYAYVWLSLAVSQGLESQKENRDEVKSRLSPTEIADAEKKAEEIAENYSKKS